MTEGEIIESSRCLHRSGPLPMPRRELNPSARGRCAECDEKDVKPPPQLSQPLVDARLIVAPRLEEDSEHVEVESAAEARILLEDNPRRWRALLFAHQSDRHGHCTVCVNVRWPCRPRKLAERAEQIRYGG
jgi:hypothetical protein